MFLCGGGGSPLNFSKTFPVSVAPVFRSILYATGINTISGEAGLGYPSRASYAPFYMHARSFLGQVPRDAARYTAISAGSATCIFPYYGLNFNCISGRNGRPSGAVFTRAGRSAVELNGLPKMSPVINYTRMLMVTGAGYNARPNFHRIRRRGRGPGTILRAAEHVTPRTVAGIRISVVTAASSLILSPGDKNM